MSDIAQRIFLGEFDSELTTIAEAARAREKIARQAATYDLKIGDRVRTIDNLRPKGLAGKFGTVQNITNVRGARHIEVKLEQPPEQWDTAFRYARDGILRGKADLVTKVGQ